MFGNAFFFGGENFPLGCPIEAINYIKAVELADGQQLEFGVKEAICNFVKSCQDDGIWDAIKASCILAGARTLEGALVPLVGVAPTPHNLTSSNYNRKTGIFHSRDRTIETNVKGNDQILNNAHRSVYITSSPVSNFNKFFMIDSVLTQSRFHLVQRQSDTGQRVQSEIFLAGFAQVQTPALFGASRGSSSQYQRILNGIVNNVSQVSSSALAPDTIRTFYGENDFEARISFYSIGKAIDLAKLDNRITTLMNTLNSLSI